MCPADAQFECVYVCMCPSFAQMWKALFVHHLETKRGRLYKIPACWSNGTAGKATIVVLTMKRLSSMALREKCPQFVFCPSRFLTLAATFPSPCPCILPLCPLLWVPTSALRYTASFSPNGSLPLPSLSLTFFHNLSLSFHLHSACLLLLSPTFSTSYSFFIFFQFFYLFLFPSQSPSLCLTLLRSFSLLPLCISACVQHYSLFDWRRNKLLTL